MIFEYQSSDLRLKDLQEVCLNPIQTKNTSMQGWQLFNCISYSTIVFCVASESEYFTELSVKGMGIFKILPSLLIENLITSYALPPP